MFDAQEFVIRAQLDAEALNAWIEAGWLAPREDGAQGRFSDIDLARARLIRELKDDLAINDEGVTVILDLLDQIHGLRRMLREILSAMHAQPDTMRRRIIADIREVAGSNQPRPAKPKRPYMDRFDQEDPG